MIQIDMDMPKCCADCDMETYEENYNGDPTFHYCPMVYKGYTDEIRDRGRLNDCPLKEVKHGHWVGVGDHPYEEYECSACGQDPCDLGDVSTWHYCPECGARMEANHDHKE